MIKTVFFIIALLLFTPTTFALEPITTDPIVIYQTEEDFDTVKFGLEIAITNQGFTLNDPLLIGDMLARTAKDLELTKTVYLQAESLDFCSVAMTHEMTQINPAYMTLCPFTIALYRTQAKPEIVHVAYRKPFVSEPELAEKIEIMLNSLIQNALEY